MKYDTSVAEVMAELHKRAQSVSALTSLLPMYQTILEMEERVDAPPLRRAYDTAQAHALLQQGVPLLQQEGGIAVPESMIAIWQQVCDLAADHLVNQGDRLQGMREWPERNREPWLALMGQYLRDGETSADNQEEKDLLTFLLVHTWRPFLRRWAAELAPFVEDGAWKHSRCPVCGGQPDFAYLGGESGERQLICARCDTEWRFQRLGCPFCTNQDASTYGYYPGENEVYRLYACGDCNRYLKVLDERQTGEGWLLMAERVATIGMDISALRAGYRGA